MLVHDKISTLEEIIEKIESITSKEIFEISNEILTLDDFSHLAFINK